MAPSGYDQTQGPLVWLGVFENPEIWIHGPDAPFCPLKNIPDIQENLGPLKLEVTKDQYVRAIDCIKDYIARGLDLRRATPRQ
ncbi:MAG: hypothetical protein LWX01_06320 [Deltaproteobacteria bacterium]|nr:hypothetical protein [Deltaproteobacteria bacterium]MDL1961302.1 hypothetical protein [Deltaproteobacteria bacterium]